MTLLAHGPLMMQYSNTVLGNKMIYVIEIPGRIFKFRSRRFEYNIMQLARNIGSASIPVSVPDKVQKVCRKYYNENWTDKIN